MLALIFFTLSLLVNFLCEVVLSLTQTFASQNIGVRVLLLSKTSKQCQTMFILLMQDGYMAECELGIWQLYDLYGLAALCFVPFEFSLSQALI